MTRAAESTYATDWNAWHQQRVDAARAPHGIASVTGTHWLTEQSNDVAGLPGRWSVVSGRAVGRLPDGRVVTLSADEEITLGEILLRAQTSHHGLGIRAFDPVAATRRNVAGIDHYPIDSKWLHNCLFRHYPQPRTVSITRADRSVTKEILIGAVELTLDTATVGDTTVRLEAFPLADGKLHISFADATRGPDTTPFRFLTLAAPEDDGRVTVDLNRAYLPPSAFTDHYLCPAPPVGNRLDVAVEAGEKKLLFVHR